MSERVLIGSGEYDPHQLSAAEIVRYARNISENNQADFAIHINKSQSIVSKYERGEVEPPGDVIIHCMTILMKHKKRSEISLEEVINRIQQSAKLPNAPFLFRAIVGILDAASIEATK